MIDPAKLGIGRQEYYLEQLARSHDEYLSGHGEAPGYTLGEAWSAFGISGEVTPEQFERAFVGEHPDTGELLGRAHRGSDGVLAFDWVFRATKSLGLLYGLGTPEMSRVATDAHQRGMRDALAYLEKFATVRRGRNGVEKVSCSGLWCVGFDHRASRPGDPLPHTHVIVINRAQGPDGRWTALDARPLFVELKNADAIYRAGYQREVTRQLGLEWGPPDAEGNRELVGLPDEVLRHFSKARCAIEEELEHREAQGLPVTPAVANFVAHAVREDKHHEAAPSQFRRWSDEAAAKGWDLPALFERLRGRVRVQNHLPAAERKAIFDQLAGGGGLTAEKSTFTRGHVIRAIANQVATLSAEEIETLADRFLAERACQVMIDTRTLAQRYSTPELLELEKLIIEQAATA
ncbi:MAG: MobF family relaxase [Egibacteraceae bacterium]